MKVDTEVRQTINAEDKTEIKSLRAEFYNGFLQRVKFYKAGTEWDIRFTLSELKEVRDFYTEIIDFADQNKKEVQAKLEEGKTKALRRIEI